jgi:hypothetical protein
VLGKNTHQHGESLNELTEPLVPKGLTSVEMPPKRATITPPDYGRHKQKDLAVLIRKIENVLECDSAVYPTERDRLLFTKQYLVCNAAAKWDQYCARHLEADHTWAAMRALLHSQVAQTKHRTDAAFQKLCSPKQGPNQTVMSFGFYIVTTCKGTDISTYNQRMFF